MCARKEKRSQLLEIYQQLFAALGPQHWWPADSPLEVIIGAILTQNTSWNNVEKAIAGLRKKDLLRPRRLLEVEEKVLAGVIRSSGFFNLKAKRIKNFIHFLFEDCRGSIAALFSEDLPLLREKLLTVNGMGPETVDSILLYAGERPVFVVDAYTRRICSRHHLIPDEAPYGAIQALFMDNLDHDAVLFNEYHALLVHVGKHFCRRRPACGACPMNGL